MYNLTHAALLQYLKKVFASAVLFSHSCLLDYYFIQNQKGFLAFPGVQSKYKLFSW